MRAAAPIRKVGVSHSLLVSRRTIIGVAAREHDPTIEKIDEERCRSFRDTVEFVGTKWTAGILAAGMRGARRFVEYRESVDGISDRLLTQRFRELEIEGLVERTVVPSTPVLITYRPTERAVGLMRALQPLVAWSIADREDAEDR